MSWIVYLLCILRTVSSYLSWPSFRIIGSTSDNLHNFGVCIHRSQCSFYACLRVPEIFVNGLIYYGLSISYTRLRIPSFANSPGSGGLDSVPTSLSRSIMIVLIVPIFKSLPSLVFDKSLIGRVSTIADSWCFRVVSQNIFAQKWNLVKFGLRDQLCIYLMEQYLK